MYRPSRSTRLQRLVVGNFNQLVSNAAEKFSLLLYRFSWIVNSVELKEIDISGNMIGIDCAQEIISALEDRKEGKMWTSMY